LPEIPRSIVAVDVETTGLSADDRIVTLGAWRIRPFDLARGCSNADYIHIIANPGRASHPRAKAVHGYSDWTLAHQQPFSVHADEVRGFLASGDIVIAHNAGFDFGFIQREFARLGQNAIQCRRYCTVDGYRQSGRAGSASLTNICTQMGLSRLGKTHGALEDSWLALMAYFWLQSLPSKLIQPFSSVLGRGISVVPTNFQEAPRQPDANGNLSERAVLDRAMDAEPPPKMRKAVFSAVRPVAVLLLEIARADKSIAATEIQIIESVVRGACTRLGIPLNERLVRQVLEDLNALNISQNLLTRSARSLCGDLIARAEFPKLVATMAAADGGLSAVKREAYDRVKAAIQRVLPKSA
jgi:DNA polymerase-3 subunit epsilon